MQKESLLFPIAADQRRYSPLPSVWFGTDAELLEKMLNFYPRKRPKAILDATVNLRRFWKGSKRKIVGLDIDPKFHPDVVADNRDMPFKNGSFDVVVYDPPHIPNQGRGHPVLQDCRLRARAPIPMGAHRAA